MCRSLSSYVVICRSLSLTSLYMSLCCCLYLSIGGCDVGLLFFSFYVLCHYVSLFPNINNTKRTTLRRTFKELFVGGVFLWGVGVSVFRFFLVYKHISNKKWSKWHNDTETQRNKRHNKLSKRHPNPPTNPPKESSINVVCVVGGCVVVCVVGGCVVCFAR